MNKLYTEGKLKPNLGCFKRGQKPPEHKLGCKCFRCTKIPWNKDTKGTMPVVWNKNLTKETNESMMRISKKLKGNNNSEKRKKAKQLREKLFFDKHQNKHFCKCGCGRKIKITRKHQWRKIPDYLVGHHKPYWLGKKRPDMKKRRKEYKTFICLNCKTKFSRPPHINRKYCSIQCCNKHKIGHHYKKISGNNTRTIIQKYDIKCLNCKNIFSVDNYRKNTAKFCSRECHNKFRKNKLKGPHSIETKKKISAKQQGIPLEEWKEFVGRKPYTWEFDQKFKNMIRERDNYACQLCSIFEEDHLKLYKRKLITHHINYDKNTSINENCITLCKRCNSMVNANRSHWTKFFQSLLSERYDYKYTEDQKIILDFTDVKIENNSRSSDTMDENIKQQEGGQRDG